MDDFLFCFYPRIELTGTGRGYILAQTRPTFPLRDHAYLGAVTPL